MNGDAWDEETWTENRQQLCDDANQNQTPGSAFSLITSLPLRSGLIPASEEPLGPAGAAAADNSTEAPPSIKGGAAM